MFSNKLFIRASFSIRDLTDKYTPSSQSVSSSAIDDQVFNLLPFLNAISFVRQEQGQHLELSPNKQPAASTFLFKMKLSLQALFYTFILRFNNTLLNAGRLSYQCPAKIEHTSFSLFKSTQTLQGTTI